jgi:hypothetical protein
MPEALVRSLPTDKSFVELVDIEHLCRDYLDKVVDACEPEGDPYHMREWYRSELLRDDRAIDRIWTNLRRLGKRLPVERTAARSAVAAALRYIRRRKNKMRYASHYAANLPIGSGATEGGVLADAGPRQAPRANVGSRRGTRSTDAYSGPERSHDHPWTRALRAMGRGVANVRREISEGAEPRGLIRIASASVATCLRREATPSGALLRLRGGLDRATPCHASSGASALLAPGRPAHRRITQRVAAGLDVPGEPPGEPG